MYKEKLMLNSDISEKRISDALFAIREKDVRSATLERLHITWKADELVQGLPQSIQLGEGLYYLLDNIPVPVSPYDLILGRIDEEIPDEEGEKLLRYTAEKWGRGIPHWMPDGGHECLDWHRLLKFGLTGLEDFAQNQLDERLLRCETGAHLDFLKGSIKIYQAMRNYAERYADSAYEAGLIEQARNCAVLAERPPETFAEAMQLIWLVGIVYCAMVSVNATLTFGRMDELLIDFYRRDLKDGTLTREEAGNLIEDFYCKNNLLLGRGEHQMSGGTENDTGWLRNLCYDAPQYVVLGGYRSDRSLPNDELTELFLERVIPGLENPVIVFRYTKGTLDHIWRIASDKMRNNSSFMVYNDEKVIPAMEHCGIEKDDAITYTMHGCNWPDIPGKERPVSGCSLSLPHYFRKALMEGDEPKNMDEIYDRFISLIATDISKCFDNLLQYRKKWNEISPGALRVDDCFSDGPIANARSWTLGGTKYSTLLGSIRFIGTATDCFSAVDDLVFSSKKISISQLRDALNKNFAGYEPLRQLCLNSPKYGQDNDRPDSHAIRILNAVTAEFDRASRFGTDDEIIATRCLTTDMGHRGEGRNLGATPDGRYAEMPFSDNTSPYPGSCTKGITAMFRSIAKLPSDRFNSGALNVRIQRKFVSGDEGLERLMALLITFFDMGGLQIQLSIADTAELRQAQENPEAHRDLMVRITGYSAVFIDMCKGAQDEIIRRQEMEE